LAIYQSLTTHGYDVFFDYLSIDSGNFEKLILENIKARAHFIVILTPSAVERCNEPGDWLRREIETAMNEKRNIIPIMLEGFDFSSPLVTDSLTGKLASLKQCNGLRLYAEYFFEAMDRLRDRYLNVSLEEVPLYQLSEEAKGIAAASRLAANKAKSVGKDQLSAQESFESNYAKAIRIPILGPIVAGLPLPNLDSSFSYMSGSEANAVEIARGLLPSQEKTENLFALEVQGDSMIDAMINDGDIVVMHPANEARNGEMVAVWLPSFNEATLTYFFDEKDRYRLQPANPTMKPIYVKKSEPLEIKGKVVMVIRRLDKAMPA
jgi:SOS-response transcriptional repressor LexA